MTVRQRERLAKLYHEGLSLAEMAKALHRSKSTVSRELSRNGTPLRRLYCPCRAQVRSEERRSQASRRPRIRNDKIRAYLREKLKLGWSPEIIAGRLPLEHRGLHVSHEAIYQYLYDRRTKDRKELILLLRRAHRLRKFRGIGRKVRKTKIPNRIPIEARPKAVDSRRTYGHWEGDTMESQKSPPVLNSLTERKSRLLMLTKLDRKAAGETKRAVVGRLAKLPPASERRSPWTTAPRIHCMKRSPPRSEPSAILLSLMPLGRGGPTNRPTAWSVGSCQRERTSVTSRMNRLPRWNPRSTTGQGSA